MPMKEITDIEQLIKNLPSCGIVAIDGHCAGGKSTLGDLLATRLGAGLFHMDDYFLPFDKQTDEIAGNIDFKRLRCEVFAGIASLQTFNTQSFDCKLQKLSFLKSHIANPLNIIEGAYSMHPCLQDYYTSSVFVKIDNEDQQKRLLQREGEEGTVIFNEKWLPQEIRYFNHFDIQMQCDYSILFNA